MRLRPIVVLDVNTIVSGFLRGNAAPGAVTRLWKQGYIDVVLSEHIVSKVFEIWERPYFRKRHDQIDRVLALTLMREQAASVVPDASILGICKDEEDDLVLGTAVAAGADYLVTGDYGFLKVRSYGDVSIVTAREFLELIGGE